MRIRCPQCRRFYAVNRDGQLHRHIPPGNVLPCARVHESELPGGGEPEEGHPTHAAWTAVCGSVPYAATRAVETEPSDS